MYQLNKQERFCGHCLFFKQHYIKVGVRYSLTDFGHCIYNNEVKTNQATACHRFSKAK